MEPLLEIIKKRRSIFPSKYTGGTIDKEHMDQILEAAKWAPTHKKTQPWRYKVFQGEGLKLLGDFMADQYIKDTGKSENKGEKVSEKFQKASAIILIFMNRYRKKSLPEWEEIAAVSMSVQNMWLMTHQLGYGCYWKSPKSFADMHQFDQIHIEPQDQFLGFFYIGTIDSKKEKLPKRKSVKEFTEFIG